MRGKPRGHNPITSPNASVSTKLAVLKEQVHQDNLKRQRLLKRFADNPSLELHLAHNGVIVLKLFLDLSHGTAQALSRSHRRAALPNPPAQRRALRMGKLTAV